MTLTGIASTVLSNPELTRWYSTLLLMLYHECSEGQTLGQRGQASVLVYNSRPNPIAMLKHPRTQLKPIDVQRVK